MTIMCWRRRSKGGADYIVTGDEDLLVLDPFEGFRIVRPQAFLAALK
jgi:predicted nucleic acid-binding protein